jgi:8-oxo-dGTP pyrophosphatase MutT (NUDIX family)
MLRLAMATWLAALLAAPRAPHAGLLYLTIPGAGYAPRAHAPRAPVPKKPWRMPELCAAAKGEAGKPGRRRRGRRRKRSNTETSASAALTAAKPDVVIGGPAAAGAAAAWARGRRRDDVKPKRAEAPAAPALTPEKEVKRSAKQVANREAAQRRRRRRRRAAANRTKVERVEIVEPPDSQKRCVCGYCGEVFASRSKLFRHLREANSCRTIALSHGMPLENPIKAVERRLRRRYGDLLLAGCIVLRVKPGYAHDPSRKASFYKSPRGLLLRGDTDDELREAPYDVVVVRGNEGKQKPGFPKGKIEPVDRTILAAALRETWEEAGLSANQLRALPHAAEAAANASARLDESARRLFSEDEVTLMESFDAVDEEEEAEAVDEDDLRFASVDVREVTGRSGKRARYFVCGLRADPPRPVELTVRHDVDGDIADASWVDVNAALVLLERKRRAALRRAVLIFNADERSSSAAAAGSK